MFFTTPLRPCFAARMLRRCSQLSLSIALLSAANSLMAWEGPYPINAPQDSEQLFTDKPLIAMRDYSCHKTGGFLFRIESESKFMRVGKLRVKFLDANGNALGSVAEEYKLQPKSQRLFAKYSPCAQAAAFSLRHEPLL